MDELSKWLESHGLAAYLEAFTENDVRLNDLAYLTEDDVRELGLPLGARRRLLTAIARIAADPGEARSPNVELPDAGETQGEPGTRAVAERRQLTVLFADLVGSTELSRKLDAEDLRNVNRAYQDVAKSAIERYEGYVARYMGDGILAYFGYPVAHEDDAERAVRAGLQLARCVSELRVLPGLAARVGIATGSVVVGDIIGEGASQERAVVGETPNLAARLQGVADPGTVIVDETTHVATGRTFRHRRLPPTRIKGFGESQSLWRLEGESDVESRFKARSHTRSAFVGRSHELGLLLERWDAAQTGEVQVVLACGEPGIGKSRIADELHEQISEREHHTRLLYQCSPYHSTTPLYPVVQQLRRAARLVDAGATDENLHKLERLLTHRTAPSSDALKLFAAVLSLPYEKAYGSLKVTPEVQRQKTIDALVEELFQVAAEQPTLLVLEDAHWIDPTTHELFKQTVSRLRDVAVMVLITHRPEWDPSFGDQPHVVSLTLSRLVSRQSSELAHAVASNSLSEEMLRQITERAGGIPLFIEELTKAILEDRSGVSMATVPVTIQASLAARIDRLDSGRAVIQAAAVIGREFEPWALSAATGISESNLVEPLDILQKSGLVYLAKANPDPIYMFKHALVQEVAYSSLLRTRRRELHSRLADALIERRQAGTSSETALLAHHLREAQRHAQAAIYWLAAARWSFSRSANEEVISQATHAIEDLDRADPGRESTGARSEANRLIGESLMAQHGFSHPSVRERLQESLMLAREIEDPIAEFRALAALAPAVLSVDGVTQYLQSLRRVVEIAEVQGDLAMRATARSFMGIGNTLLGDQLTAEQYLAEAWELSGNAEFAVTPSTAGADFRVPLLGYLSFTQMLRCEPERAKQSIDRASALAGRYDDAFTTAWVHTVAGRVLTYRGKLTEATEALDRAIEICEENGFSQREGHARCLRGLARSRSGFSDQGLLDLTEGLTLWQTDGSMFHSTEYLTYIAEIHLADGQVDGALLRLDQADDLGRRTGEGFYDSERMRLRARCLALAGRESEAVSLLEAALALSERQGAWLFNLRVALDLAGQYDRQVRRSEAIRLIKITLAACAAGTELPDHETATAFLADLEHRG